MKRFKIEAEEVYGLANRKGIPKTEIVTKTDWFRAWT
jgi:hypothetical protein